MDDFGKERRALHEAVRGIARLGPAIGALLLVGMHDVKGGRDPADRDVDTGQ